MKLSVKHLRKIIKEEAAKVKRSKRFTLSSFLFEQDEETEASGNLGDAPKGTAIDKTTNVKDVDPVEIANQLLSGDDNSPIVQSAQVGKPWIEFTGAAGKAWIEKIGPDVFVKRLKDLADKVPTTGLPKKVMPFLPGPDDAKGTYADVEDALTPGGNYNIDVAEPFKEAAWKKGMRFLMEKEEEQKEKKVKGNKGGRPPAPNSFAGLDDPDSQEFMTAGLEDGDPGDDKITITKGGGVVASDAIPTQSNILIYKSLGMAVNGTAGGDLDAWAGTGGEILDGHHRWAATMLNDPTAEMGTAGQVDLGALDDPQDVLKYLTAIGNALGNPTKLESRKRKNNVILERWQKLSGLIKE